VMIPLLGRSGHDRFEAESPIPPAFLKPRAG
jgi:hypothetical protein